VCLLSLPHTLHHSWSFFLCNFFPFATKHSWSSQKNPKQNFKT
jgi:hypothetical protein